MSSRSPCGVACAITHRNTWHQCRKLFCRYSTSFSSSPCHLPVLALLSQVVTRSTKFRRVHIRVFSSARLAATGLYRKKLAIENAGLVTFSRYNINSGNGSVNILRTVASIQCGSGNVMRYVEVLPASLASCFRQIFPTGAPQTQKTIVSQ